ncbi:MAG: hypothetical protein IPK26_10040 [Planctomycetes bacterium]|nr:hypothetical protein [Planctomycetota bacterium]
MRPSCVALLLLAFAAAQERPPVAANLANALRSDDAVTVAWAAHDARECGDKSTIPALRQALRRWESNENQNATQVRPFVLDALIELDARVPAEELTSQIDDERCGNAALILLLRESRVNERQLLELFAGRTWHDGFLLRQDPEIRTLAIGAVLCQQRAPGFSALLWSRLDHRLHVTVPDDDPGVWSVSIGRPRRPESAKVGFPPTVRYVLTFGPSWNKLGDLWYARQQAEGQEFGVCASFDAHIWLHELTQKAPTAAVRTPTIPFTTADAWKRDVRSARAQLQIELGECLRDLVRGGAMTEAEAAAAKAQTEVGVVIHDQAKHRAEPLPEIER